MALGDLVVRQASGYTTWLPVGTDGDVLTADSGEPLGVTWAPAGGGGLVALADGGTGSSLSDPGADRIMFWDDSAGAVDWLTAGTNLTITGTTINASGGSGPGTELDYVQITSSVTVTATSAATATTVITGNSVSYSGSQRIMVQLFAPFGFAATSGQDLFVTLWDGSTDLGVLSDVFGGSSSVSAQINGVRLLTPSAGSHTFHFKAYKTGGAGTFQIGAGPGGTGGAYLPAFLRITEA